VEVEMEVEVDFSDDMEGDNAKFWSLLFILIFSSNWQFYCYRVFFVIFGTNM
jgi:hypothetical protein